MPQIPNSILRDLKCGHCGNWLSCGPIYVLPLGNTICGRCKHVAIKKFRHFAYEALAEFFQYPCMYYRKHCNRILKWNEALHHEHDCSYKNFCNTLCKHPSVLFKADKKLMIEEVETYAYVPDKILDSYLKCCVCECYLSCSPVFVRPDGRSICHRCITSNGPPTDGSIRHFSYEKLAGKILFPCIYRYRGCAQHFKFGRDVWNHEIDCPYGQMYKKPSKQVQKGQKERGVIETHTGHVYGTITPNSFQLFAPPSQVKRTSSNLPIIHKREQSNEESEFVNELKKKQEKFTKKTEDNNSRSSIVSNASSQENRQKTYDQKTPPSAETNARFSFRAKNLTPDDVKIPKIAMNNSQGNFHRSTSLYSNGDGGKSPKVDGDAMRKTSPPKFRPVQNLDDIFWVHDDIENRYKMGK